jgi:hypothetical protein
MVGRATRDCQRGTVETKFPKIQLIDEDVYDPDRVVLSDVVIGLRCDMIALPLLRDGKMTGDKNAKKKGFCKFRL